jgi:hypothetical protein
MIQQLYYMAVYKWRCAPFYCVLSYKASHYQTGSFYETVTPCIKIIAFQKVNKYVK